MRARRLALCVDIWRSEENHYAWMWTRKRLLQDQRQPGEDHLYVVHVSRNKGSSGRWDIGGPLLGDASAVLEGLNATIVELEGDTCASLSKFAEETKIDILILGSKQASRMKRTVTRSTSVQLVQKAACACVVVSPRITAGEHYRIQAARDSDVLGANMSMQFRRKVAIVLNAPLYDANLVQYAARNVLLPRDRVVLVRCLNKNLRSKNNQMDVERDTVREIGRTKLMGADVDMAVEVLEGGLRMLRTFVESKGIDLVVMMRNEERRIRRPLQPGIPALQSLPHRCPCPCMVVPGNCLEFLSGSSSSSRCQTLPIIDVHPFIPRPDTIGKSTGMLRLARRPKSNSMNWRSGGVGGGVGIWKAGGSVRKPFGRARARSMDAVEFLGDDARVMEVIQDEAIELEAIEELELEGLNVQQGGGIDGGEENEGGGIADFGGSGGSGGSENLNIGGGGGGGPHFARLHSLPLSQASSSCPSPVGLDLRRKSMNDVVDVVDMLEKQLEEKEREILKLKERISLLQSKTEGDE